VITFADAKPNLDIGETPLVKNDSEFVLGPCASNAGGVQIAPDCEGFLTSAAHRLNDPQRWRESEIRQGRNRENCVAVRELDREKRLDVGSGHVGSEGRSDQTNDASGNDDGT
jgi:hypothetical protein